MTNNKIESNWFEGWFDSEYYHILYQNRDEKEAALFIENLVNFLQIDHKKTVLDLACGKGRHALYLSKSYEKVYGADLSANSIREAKKMEAENLSFFVHDMRDTLPLQNLDIVFNLFTSFGYFDRQEDNFKVMQAVHEALVPKGLFVIDFMNAKKVINNLVREETKSCSDFTFAINRWEDGAHIYKKISFDAANKEQTFLERVQIVTLTDFKNFLEKSGFELLNTFGSFNLDSFDEATSDRLILIAQKK